MILIILTIYHVAALVGTYYVTTLAGADGSLSAITGIAVDSNSDVFFGEYAVDCIKSVSSLENSNSISIRGGTCGSPGYVDGFVGTARFNGTKGIATGLYQELYICDNINHVRIIRSGNYTSSLAGADFECAALLEKTNGTLYVISGNLILVRGNTQSFIAGNVTGGYSDDFGSNAQFNEPQGIANYTIDLIYIADTQNHLIRKINVTSGQVTTVAGSYGASPGLLDGQGTSAKFNLPTGLVVDASGNIFVADKGNHAIRLISPSGMVTTIAGNGSALVNTNSTTAYPGNGFGSSARFYEPNAITMDIKGNLIVGEYGNRMIRKIAIRFNVFKFSHAPEAYNITVGCKRSTFLIISLNVSSGLSNYIKTLPQYGLIYVYPYMTGSQAITENNFLINGTLLVYLSDGLPTATETDIFQIYQKDSHNTTSNATVTVFVCEFGMFYQDGACIIETLADLTLTTAENSPNPISFMLAYKDSLVYQIDSLPQYGKLYTTNSSSSLTLNQTVLQNTTLYYQADPNYFGNITFLYHGVLKFSKITNRAALSISVSFFNSPPLFLQTNETIYIYPNVSTYSLDLKALFFDADETQYTNITFDILPLRGTWRLNGNLFLRSTNDSSLQILYPLSNSSTQILSLALDSLGAGSTQYFTLSISLKDSWGAPSVSQMLIFGTLICPIGQSYTSISSAGLCTGPVVYNGSYITTENTNTPLLIPFNSNTIISLGFFIQTLPRHGRSYQSSSGIMGAEIISNYSAALSNQVLYQPNTNFYGSDIFYVYAVKTISSNVANIVLSVTFVNQAPFFTTANYNVIIPENSTYVALDILSLVSDPDELNYFTIIFNTFPSRGIWSTPNTGYLTSSFLPTILPLNNLNNQLLVFIDDTSGGSSPYFSFSISVKDSYGLLSSSSSLTIRGDIQCGSGKYINTASSGKLCVGPHAFNSSVSGNENQDFILVTLSATTLSSNTLIYYISSLPSNGTLYQYILGSLGSQISTILTPLISVNQLFYKPNTNHYGDDLFQFYAKDVIETNAATVKIFINFVNQAPLFTVESYLFTISELTTWLSVDLFPLISDPDEFSNYTITYLSVPNRGIWYDMDGIPTGVFPTKTYSFAANRIMTQMVLNFTIPSLNLNEIFNTAYFEFQIKVSDSYGLPSLKPLTIKAVVVCSPLTSLNIWSGGAICKTCPIGAICSATGNFSLTNQYGYFPLDSGAFIPCFPIEACPAEAYTLGVMHCGGGYGGSRCGECITNFYRYSNICKACPKNTISTPWLIVLGMVVIC